MKESFINASEFSLLQFEKYFRSTTLFCSFSTAFLSILSVLAQQPLADFEYKNSVWVAKKGGITTLTSNNPSLLLYIPYSLEVQVLAVDDLRVNRESKTTTVGAEYGTYNYQDRFISYTTITYINTNND